MLLLITCKRERNQTRVEAVKLGGGELAVCLTFWMTTVTMKQKENKELPSGKQNNSSEANGVNRRGGRNPG